MSRHDYSQYSDNKNKKNEFEVSESVDTTNVDAETVVESENVVAPEVTMVVEEVGTVGLPETVEGVVANCAKLNVRANPRVDADVVCVLDAASEIEINVTKSTDDWFSVCTATGIEGYCMRKFVNAHL